MTAVIRLALPRLSASIMISCSISQSFTGAGQDCRTKVSLPRTDSWKRRKISPLANSRAVCAVTWTSSSLATCSASSGCARPEKSIRVLRLSVQSWLTLLPSPSGIKIKNGTPHRRRRASMGCRIAARVASLRLLGFRCSGRLVGGLGGGGAGPLALHPVLDVALRSGRDRQRSGRDIVAHHRAGAGVSAVADSHRRHEHGVRTGADVGADCGALLGRSVVVDEDAG